MVRYGAIGGAIAAACVIALLGASAPGDAQLQRSRRAAYYAALDEATADCPDRACAVVESARYLCETLANHCEEYSPDQNDPLAWWEDRRGNCGARARLLCIAAGRYNAPCRVAQVWEGFPNAHTACEVWLDDAWRYIDPTYGGYFEAADGSILPLGAVLRREWARMVVFERTFDVGCDGSAVDNLERMRTVYGESKQ